MWWTQLRNLSDRKKQLFHLIHPNKVKSQFEIQLWDHSYKCGWPKKKKESWALVAEIALLHTVRPQPRALHWETSHPMLLLDIEGETNSGSNSVHSEFWITLGRCLYLFLLIVELHLLLSWNIKSLLLSIAFQMSKKCFLFSNAFMISNLCLRLITVFYLLKSWSTQVARLFQFLQSFFLSAKMLLVMYLLPNAVS